jgi:hypothetical protein
VVPGISIAKTSYAVAVRDGEELYLLITVNREGDNVYVNSPRPGEPEWNPHASYHASGQHHAKSFNHKFSTASVNDLIRISAAPRAWSTYISN